MNSLEKDEGKYECVARNGDYVAHSKAAHLYVKGLFILYIYTLSAISMLFHTKGNDLSMHHPTGSSGCSSTQHSTCSFKQLFCIYTWSLSIYCIYTWSLSIYCITLVRRVPPHFSIPPNNTYKVGPGGSVDLNCVAVGYPMPRVFWRRGYHETLQDPDNAPVGKNVLTLKDVERSENYTCVAVSKLGNIEFLTKVLVKGNDAIQLRFYCV